MENEKIIWIGGGVGPLAGVKLHQYVIEQTRTNGTDQDHLEVHHDSRSSDIQDRTRFLLGEIAENPAEGMFRGLRQDQAGAGLHGRETVAGVPCNTFHAEPIFGRFKALVKQEGYPVQVLNMIEETAAMIREIAPKARKLGLMSTTGTRKLKIYNQALEPLGFEVVEVPETSQAELHDSIYNPEWGIKAVSPVSLKARANFEAFARTLKQNGAEAIILGCTEIPLALPEKSFDGLPLVDPMLALARALIREASRTKLKPYLK